MLNCIRQTRGQMHGSYFSREQLKYAQALAQKEKVKPPLVEGNIQRPRIKSHYYDIVLLLTQYSTLGFEQMLQEY